MRHQPTKFLKEVHHNEFDSLIKNPSWLWNSFNAAVLNKYPFIFNKNFWVAIRINPRVIPFLKATNRLTDCSRRFFVMSKGREDRSWFRTAKDFRSLAIQSSAYCSNFWFTSRRSGVKILESEKEGSPVGNTWKGKFVNDLYPDLNPSIDISLCCPHWFIELESKFSIYIKLSKFINLRCSTCSSMTSIRVCHRLPPANTTRIIKNMHLLLLPGLLLDLKSK